MRLTKRSALLVVSGVATLAMIVAGFFAVTSNSHAAASASGSVQNLSYVGTTSMSVSGSQATSSGTQYEISPAANQDDTSVPRNGQNPGAPHAAPAPGSSKIAADATAPGFNGLSHADQRLAGTGKYAGTQFSLEPPDQALCVGNGFVLESVNTALRAYHTDGSPAGPTVALNQFFNLAPEINRSTLVYGDFTSDPKCYYDAPTGRFFFSLLHLSVDPATGNFSGTSSQLLAVSQSNDPTGTWNLFSFDTTDGNGSVAGHPNCPCFGDQPLIGADANGFYVSTNEYPIFVNGFNGSQVYAISKRAIESAGSGSTLSIVHINAGAMPTPDVGGIWYSIQPATTPPGGAYESANNGTEYFLSSLQFGPSPYDNRIATWALTNTASLNTRKPAVSLSEVVISSEVYGQPPNAQQANGSRPLAESYLGQYYGYKGATPPLEFIDGNDDRMNQVVFANGMLWSGVNTVTLSENAPVVGIAYFIVSPSDPKGTLSATMANQGYVMIDRDSVLYPSIGVNPQGKGVITFTVAGKDYYPSAGYASIDATNGVGDVHIALAGAGPEDGFTGYAVFGGNGSSRWGDYSAAVADENGTIWFATEYIPNAPRTILANWGTFVGHVAR